MNFKNITETAKNAVKTGLASNFGLDGAQGPQDPQQEHRGLVQPTTKFYWKMLPPKKGNYDGTSQGSLRNSTGFGPAPRLAPQDESPNVANIDDNTIKPSTHVNVRDDHHWTESPISSRGEVPMLMLKEYKIMTNPMLNQLYNNVAVAVEAGVSMTDDLKSIKSKLVDLAKAEDEGSKNGRPSTVMGTAERVRKNIGEKIQTGIERAESMFANPMNPYDFLYTVKPTHFKYTFPYMENTFRNLSNNFGETTDSATGFLGDLNDLAAAATNIASMTGRRLMAPGRMVEEPTGFSFSGRENSYTVTFPLFNTKNFDEVIKNWQFLFLLVYQNTPNRITKDLIDPPCIYEARIPGLWYSKYACISNLQVEFKGSRRELPMPVPYLEPATSSGWQGTGNEEWLTTNRKITTIIPDAYQVSITIRELFGETQNFMYHMLRETMDSKVQVNGVSTV